jgi:uncharacterized protein YbjT (DUF2867 family)
MRIAVAGGTGLVGTYTVQAAEAAGHSVAVLARSRGVDLVSGRGVEDALAGVDVVIDASNVDSRARAEVTDFFVSSTTNLQKAAAAQGVSGIVVLSIVGIDRVPEFGYYAGKLAQEEAAFAGPVPVTVARVTQFHEFAAQVMLGMRRGPLAPVPSMRTQTVAARSVGAELVRLAGEPFTGETVEIAGPRPESLVAHARQVVARQGKRLLVLPLWVPGAVGRGLRGGALLPGAGARLIGPSFSEWVGSEDALTPRL